MPRQNRVTPFGEIVATAERGTFMGNRGILHDSNGQISRPWKEKRWIVCVLEFRGRKRTAMTTNFYTELFFLDEATALAAGHRPCAECRRERFIAFCSAWKAAHPEGQCSQRPTAEEIDERLHAERVNGDRTKRFFTAALDEMPDGVFVTIAAWGNQAFLVQGDHLLSWSPGGYGERTERPKEVDVRILTPRSTVQVILAGYVPVIHLSAATA